MNDTNSNSLKLTESNKINQVEQITILENNNVLPVNKDIPGNSTSKSEDQEEKSIINFLNIVGRLKHLPRRGWQQQGIINAETITSHMYRMVIMAMMFSEEAGLDLIKTVQMCALHDLAEAVVGDITPEDGVHKDHKHRLEIQAMRGMTKLLPQAAKNRFMNMFLEYEDRKTPEANFVKDLDNLDLLIQAFEYEKEIKKPGHFDDFFRSVGDMSSASMPIARKLYHQLMTQRAEFFKNPDSFTNNTYLSHEFLTEHTDMHKPYLSPQKRPLENSDANSPSPSGEENASVTEGLVICDKKFKKE